MADEQAKQRDVAGVWCGEVLALLPQVEDGTLGSADLARVRAHVAGCDWCERFGGAYGAVVGALRRLESGAPDGLAERLSARLGRFLEGG
jgi:hypothetical protein